ncbi:MAG: hypothetical protein R3A52_09475 [Polyangiales bacterium]
MSRSWLGLVVLAALGCSSSDAASGVGRRNNVDPSREPRGEPMPHEECVTGSAETRDVNGDGRPDVRTQMVDGRPRCRETDANFDGRVDIYRWFDASGQVTRVEDDYDFDGRVDVVATFEGGVVVRDILDTNFDGRTDTWREYRNGHVAELRRDSDGDGRVDTWERFDDQGRLTWSAVDSNHDGTPDADSADAGAPATPTATPPATPPQGGLGVSTPVAPAETAPTTTTPTTTPSAQSGSTP